MFVSNAQANVLSRLRRRATDAEDKTGSPGSIVNAVAGELHENDLCMAEMGDEHYSNIGEEMKMVREKRRSVSFCNACLIYPAVAGKRLRKAHLTASYQKTSS